MMAMEKAWDDVDGGGAWKTDAVVVMIKNGNGGTSGMREI